MITTFQTEGIIIPPDIMSQLEKRGQVKKYLSGEMILDVEDCISKIPVVKSGSIKILRTEEDGREILLYYLKPGEGCLMSILGSVCHTSSKIKAEVYEDAEILFVPTSFFGELVKTNPQVLDYVFNLYNRRFEELLNIVNEISFKKTDVRLLNLLNKKSSILGVKEFSITHEQLAGELGTVRVVVSRILKNMEDNGLVKLGRNKITLV